MERKVLFEGEKLKLEYIAEGNYIHETWRGFTSHDVFSENMHTLLKHMKETEATGILNDAREHKGLSIESQQFASKLIGELAEKLGGLREAILLPQNAFSQFSVENYAKTLKEKEEPVETMFFETVEKAEAWLRKGV